MKRIFVWGLVVLTSLVSIGAAAQRKASKNPVNLAPVSETSVVLPTPGMNPPHPPRLPEEGIPAFPGAWGAGMFTSGGRGGKVIAVTTLADKGPGSLREALMTEGPRIIIFKVAGTIEVEDKLDIDYPDVTIAGQTAPGDGICIAGELNINTYNVILRHLRVRRGIAEGYQDCIGGNPDHHVIIDHCSASWGRDENIAIYRHMRPSLDGSTRIKDPSRYVTVQWCISSEALNIVNYDHSCAGTWGGEPCTFHHNLLACNISRNPSIGMSGSFDFRNNVIFNWKHRTIDGGDETSLVNVINNYFKPGPSTLDDARSRIARMEERKMYSPGSAWAEGDWYNKEVNPKVRPGKWYVAGNLMEGNDTVTMDNWKGVEGDESLGRVNTPFTGWPVAPFQTASDAYVSVIQGSGATLPHRDPVDLRVLKMAQSGEVTSPHGGQLENIDEVGGFPLLQFQPSDVLADSDSDGMPDVWEKAHSLNPEDASDASADTDEDGYTNMEEYLNGTDPLEYKNYRNLANNVDDISFRQPVAF